MINKALTEQKIPTTWKRAQRYSKKEPNNYRGINEKLTNKIPVKMAFGKGTH